MKILLPVDGSAVTKRMLAYVAAHDDMFGTGHDYLAFTVVAQVPHYAARFLEREALAGYHQEQADEVLNTVRSFAARQGWALRTAHAPGSAAEEIAAVARAERPDLIVMGPHGRTGLRNVLLGSVAAGVLARCKVPVLFVR